MTDRRFLLILAGLGCGFGAFAASGARSLWARTDPGVAWAMLLGALVYAGAAWLVLRHDANRSLPALRRALFLILGLAAVLRVVLIVAPPMSTDVYRYVWDGRVQAAGINPYRYRPADPELAGLRDETIFPNINRAEIAPTIYPPMAQVIYLAATRISDTVVGIKAAMVAFEIATMAAILALLRRRGLPETRVLLYAWHPLPLFEFAGSGHVDAAAIAFAMLACLAADRRHPVLAGALLAAGALVKYFPVVIAPALYRRWGWRMPAAALLVAVAVYLPYLGVGRGVLGYLPGYAEEESLTTGTGFFLLGALGQVTALPAWTTAAYGLAGLAVLAGLALAAVFRPRPEAVSLVFALLLLGTFTLILSPHVAWYFTWLVPFLCFRPSLALVYLTGSAPFLYGLVWDPGDVARSALLYVPFGAILAWELSAGRLRSPAPEAMSHAG